MISHWLKNLCFPVLLLAAICLWGLYAISPRVVRNLQLEQQVFEQQWELIGLERRNQERLTLLKKKEQQPEWLSQNDPTETEKTTELIKVPQNLAIHPDQLWQLGKVADAEQELRVHQLERWGLSLELWQRIAQPGFWRRCLFWFSILLGFIAWLSALPAPAKTLSAATVDLTRLIEGRYGKRSAIEEQK